MHKRRDCTPAEATYFHYPVNLYTTFITVIIQRSYLLYGKIPASQLRVKLHRFIHNGWTRLSKLSIGEGGMSQQCFSLGPVKIHLHCRVQPLGWDHLHITLKHIQKWGCMYFFKALTRRVTEQCTKRQRMNSYRWQSSAQFWDWKLLASSLMKITLSIDS